MYNYFSNTPLVRWLTEPGASIPEAKRRRTRLLSWMLLSLILLAAVAVVVTIMVNPNGNPRRGEYVSLILLCELILILAYTLNHRGHYVASAYLTIACAVFAPWASLASDPEILNGDFVPLTYIVVPILLCSILLSARVTTCVASLQIAVLLLVFILRPVTASINWPSLIVFALFLSILSIVANVINQRDLQQISEQTEQLAQSEMLLREQSVRDSLTGLFNRRYLDETLERELKRAKRYRKKLGIMMIDIDNFKQFNDANGHAAGDFLLHEIGKTLRNNLRESDIACRYGGDEFTLVLPDIDLVILRNRADSLHRDVQKLELQRDQNRFSMITISLGVALFPEHGDNIQSLVHASDTALYRAKREGKNRVVVAG